MSAPIATDKASAQAIEQVAAVASNQTPTMKSSGATLTTGGSHSRFDEKNAQYSIDERRDSDLSSPCSVHDDNPFDTDIEAMVPTPSDNNLSRKTTSHPKKNQDCPVWPGKEHWKQKAKDAKKKQRSCTCMAGLSKRTRIIVKILIVLLVIGIAIGVGVGISKPLGAPMWNPKPA